MPYGISRKVGGDTPALDKKVEDCVARLTAKGYSKVSAIKICKVSVQKKAAKSSSAQSAATNQTQPQTHSTPPQTLSVQNVAAPAQAPAAPQKGAVPPALARYQAERRAHTAPPTSTAPQATAAPAKAKRKLPPALVAHQFKKKGAK